MMLIHEIKLNKCYWMRVQKGIKRFEIRFNDRDYQVGDKVKFIEYPINSNEIGRHMYATITYITTFEQKDNWVVFGFELDNLP